MIAIRAEHELDPAMEMEFTEGGWLRLRELNGFDNNTVTLDPKQQAALLKALVNRG